MTRLRLLLWREMRGLVLSPVVWLFVALAWFVSGVYFRFSVLPRSGGDLPSMVRLAADWGMQVQIVLAPLLTMRMLAEERRSGTFEVLVTAPVRDHEVVLSKFLAAACVSAFTWLVLPLYFYVLQGMGGEPDMGVVWNTWAGLALVSAVFVALSLLASATTQHQILAGFLGLVLILLLLFVPGMAGDLEGIVGGRIAGVLSAGSLARQVQESAAGILDIVNVTYQVALACLFLLFTVRVVEVRKWR